MKRTCSLVNALLSARVFFARNCLGIRFKPLTSALILSLAVWLTTVSTRAMFFLTKRIFPSLEAAPFVACATLNCITSFSEVREFLLSGIIGRKVCNVEAAEAYRKDNATNLTKLCLQVIDLLHQLLLLLGAQLVGLDLCHFVLTANFERLQAAPLE